MQVTTFGFAIKEAGKTARKEEGHSRPTAAPLGSFDAPYKHHHGHAPGRARAGRQRQGTASRQPANPRPRSESGVIPSGAARAPALN
ncbi:hypothetical protein GUJ93_ZPchr0043g16396 [Zizania palustris]|uniref:Uncharacterized protein n=1 Tax=Zizania palustris TaxID=103762 RepID=A0A8J5R2L3_ZIZPA|nr:hypothetical protein GUJ93_ZPchr0043g16396 [Zizania palustris]